MFHSNGRGEAAEEETAWFQDAPSALQHGAKVIVIFGEVEYGVAYDYVGKSVWEGGLFKFFGAKAFGGERRREECGQMTHLFDGVWIGVRGEDLVAFLKEIDQISAGSAACIEDAHSRRDAAAEELIEEVDVNLAELMLKVEHPPF